MPNVLALSAKAQEYYEKTRGKMMISGYERNVLVREDFENCLFVNSDYELMPGDYVFRLKTVNRSTIIELKKFMK